MGVIVVSGEATEDRVEASLAAGADSHLIKPFSFEQLKTRIDGLLR